MKQSSFLLSVAICLILLIPTNLTSNPLFFPARLDSLSYRADLIATSTLSEDFNEDGNKDVAVFSVEGGNAELLLGDGDGLFYKRIGLGVEGVTDQRAVDLNGDGHLDLALTSNVCCDQVAGSWLALLGNGKGSFSESWTTGFTSFIVRNIAVEDFDEDGEWDVVSYSFLPPGGTHSIRFYRGDGAGSFTLVSSFEPGESVSRMVSGDFNGDDRVDLCTLTSSDLIHVYPGDGAGSFGVAITTSGLNGGDSVEATELNGDSHPDLVVSDHELIQILLGDGAGSFTAAGDISIQEGTPYLLQVADVDADGFTDLIWPRDNAVLEFYYGDGTGDFNKGDSLETTSARMAFCVKDFSNDGIPDLFTSGYCEKEAASVYIGIGNGKFADADTFRPGRDPHDAAVTDLNNDAHLDLVFADSYDQAVSILRGDGTGDFSDGGAFDAGFEVSLVDVADFNRDGNSDVIAAGSPAHALLLLGDGKGNLIPQTPAAIPPKASSIDVGHINADGRVDALVACDFWGGPTGNVQALLGDGVGDFTSIVPTSTDGKPLFVTLEDFNEDQHLDFIALTYPGGTSGADLNLEFFMGNGTGNFQKGADIDGSVSNPWIGSVDLNADGHLDLVCTDTHVWYGNGDGTFLEGEPYTWIAGDGKGALADFNNDGRIDLAGTSQHRNGTCDDFQGIVSVILGSPPAPGQWELGGVPPTGMYESVFREGNMAFGVKDLPTAVYAGDFNEDGDVDLFSLNMGDANISLLLNDSAHNWNLSCGRGPGAGAEVGLFRNGKRSSARYFYPYRSGSQFGTFVARANLDGEGLDEIVTGADQGGSAHVKTFTSRSGPYKSEQTDRLVTFLAYESSFRGGVRVAAGDLDNDGFDEIITGPGPGSSPMVRVFDRDGRFLHEFLAFDPSFTGGVYVAAGDVNGDSLDEIVVGKDRGSTPDVRVFEGDGTPSGVDIRAYKATFAGGVRVACGDLNGDGAAEIVTAAGRGASPHVRTFLGDGRRYGVQFFAYKDGFKGGVFVAAYDLDGDGRDEIITGAGENGAPHVRVFSELGDPTGVSFRAFEQSFRGGVRVAAGNWGN